MKKTWISVEKLELTENAYNVSCFCHFGKKTLAINNLNKKQIKRLLVNDIDEDIWFTHLRDDIRFQMFL